MKPSFIVLDNFFDYPTQVLDEVSRTPMRDHVATDGITYPGIFAEVPTWIKSIKVGTVQSCFGRSIGDTLTFARLTTPTISAAPNKIHCDRLMGHYAAHVYLSKVWPRGSGTSFWRHKSFGDCYLPSTDTKAIDSDSNDETKWEFVNLIPARFNRCLIHDANLWHRADPVGGFGTDASSGRLVLTTFFKVL